MRGEGRQRVTPVESTVFRHVLVCLDRSEVSERSLPLSLHLASVGGSRVTLLYVLEAHPQSPESRVTDALRWEISRGEARTYLEEVSARQPTSVEARVAEGNAVERIVAVARELGADLVSIATHGEGGVGAWSLGGTAEKVLASTPSSVLVTPAQNGGPTHIPPRRLLLPLDGSRRTESVLPRAVRLARASDAELLLAHVVWEPIVTEILRHDEDLALARDLSERQAANARSYLDGLCQRVALDGVRARSIVRHGYDRREALISLATVEHADLIVLSAHGSVCNAQRQFGSVASYLIAHSSVPLLVVQDLPERTSRSTPVPGALRPAGPTPQRSTDAGSRR